MKAQHILLLASVVFTFNMATTNKFKVDAYDPDVEIWESYEERLVQYFVANEVTEDGKKVAILLSSMGPKGYGLLKNLVTPLKPSSMTLADICKHLKEYFNPRPPVLLERFRFYNRSQGSSEGVSKFLAELKHLSRSCNFGTFLEDALRDRFVCGVFDTNIQKRLLSEDDSLTLEKAVKIALSMESAAKNTVIIKEGSLSQSIHSMLSSAKHNPNKVQCSCCGRQGHVKSNCRMKDYKCFNCGRVGHLQSVCRQSSDQRKREDQRNEFQELRVGHHSWKMKTMLGEKTES